MKAYTYDFSAFIHENADHVFGKEKNILGQPMTKIYKRQIDALNVKMNEVIDTYGTEDKSFLTRFIWNGC